MSYHAGAHHIHVDVYDAVEQVLVGAYGGGVIAVLPECARAAWRYGHWDAAITNAL